MRTMPYTKLLKNTIQQFMHSLGQWSCTQASVQCFFILEGSNAKLSSALHCDMNNVDKMIVLVQLELVCHPHVEKYLCTETLMQTE